MWTSSSDFSAGDSFLPGGPQCSCGTPTTPSCGMSYLNGISLRVLLLEFEVRNCFLLLSCSRECRTSTAVVAAAVRDLGGDS